MRKAKRAEEKTIGKVAMTNGVTEEESFDVEMLKIDPAVLDYELQEQPSQFAYWAVKAAKRRAEMERLKNNLKTTESDIELQERERMARAGEKVTEAAVKANVLTNDEYKAAIAEYNDAIRRSYVTEAIARAYETRSSMLIALAANRRAEMDNNLFVNKKSK